MGCTVGKLAVAVWRDSCRRLGAVVVGRLPDAGLVACVTAKP